MARVGGSALDEARAAYRPRLPELLAEGLGRSAFEPGSGSTGSADAAEIHGLFPATFGQPLLELARDRAAAPSRPLRAGIVLSGGPAPGGHNVVSGLHDGLRCFDAGSRLLGFLGGPRGIVEGRTTELEESVLAAYRNGGGFDLLGSGRHKLESASDLEQSRRTCEALQLDGLVVVGGDDSNTNAAVLAEHFATHRARTVVIGVPKTIDGDLKGPYLETSFGFDTATKVYSELVGNLCRDAKSTGKYWHFVRLMGRSASHVTLECALRTRANVAVIAEEVHEQALTLRRVAASVADVVAARAAAGRSYGVCLVPEGLLEFVPEARRLIDELNRVLAGRAGAASDPDERERLALSELSRTGREAAESLPPPILRQLLLDRDAHGNVQVSRIETERLLAELVRIELERRGAGGALASQCHFLGYEGRCAAPSNFDADYAYGLGRLASALVAHGRTGYVCSIRDLASPRERWRPHAVPLTALLQVETRKGRRVPVIGKALVRTDGAPFRALEAGRARWGLEDAYRYPGALQYFGPPELCDAATETLRLEFPPGA